MAINRWEWPQGVALFGLYLYYKENRDEAVLEWMLRWYRTQFDAGLPELNINTACPLLALAHIHDRSDDPRFLPKLESSAEYIMRKLPRTEEGGFQHVVTGAFNEGELWDDTLYMTVLFLARMGVLLGRAEYIDESVRQFLVHIKYLTDPKTGLLYHGWTFKGRHHFAGALWGRGNSWYTAGVADYLERVPVPDGVRWHLISSLETQVAALAKLQDASGLWHTLLNEPCTYLETSASAAFAYGILKSVRLGLIPEKYRSVGLAALRGVLSRVDEEGIVQGVSYGTGMSNDLDYYRNIKQCPMPYGQSMALLMLVEAMKHPES